VTWHPSRLAALVAVWLAPLVGRAQVQSEVRGRVTAAADGSGLPGATIDDAQGEAGAVAGGGGAFVLRGLSPGVHTLRVIAVGFRPAAMTVAVENGRATDASVALAPTVAHLTTIAVTAAADSAPAGATVLTHADIVASGRQDIADLLDRVPGVVVTRQGGPGGRATLSVRGSSASEVLVLVDGVPINSHLTGEADLSGIPVSSIERITVIPGAQSARYGSRALAGVVVVQTRQPDGAQVEAQGSVGAWGDRDGSVSLGAGSSDGVGGRVTAERRTSQGDFPFDQLAVRGGGTGVRRNNDAGTTSFNGALRFPAGPLSVQLRASEVDGARGVPSSIATQDTTARENNTRTSGGVSVRQDAGRVSWSADLDVDHEHESDRDSLPTFGGPPYDDHVTATSVDGRVAATRAWRDVSVTLGGEARTLDVTASALNDAAPPTEYEDGVWAAVRGAHHFGPVLATLDAAVRADWASLVRGATVSPHVGLSLADGPVVVSVSGGQAFSPPTLADEFFHEGVLVKPNPDLSPERVRNEVEARVAVRDIGWDALRLSAQAAVYRADVSGMILWFPNFQFVWSPQNTDVHRSGWDAGGELALPHVGVTLRGSVSDVAVDYAGPVLGGQIAYRPRVTADLGASATRGRFTVDWNSRYIGDRRTVQGSGLNALAAYWISDAHLTIRAPTGAWPVDVFGGVDDLFDRRADLLVDYPYAGRTWVVGLRVRSPGRGRL
jgi:outer membrane cobalamin receptor